MMSGTKTRYCGCFEEKFKHNNSNYNLIKEQIGFSYIKSIASFFGSELIEHGRMIDNEGIDLTIRAPQNRFRGFRNTKPSLDIQMKCTSTPDYDSSGDYLNLTIDVEVYKKMLEPAASPTILMILVMPDDPDLWVKIDEQGLRITREMIWYSASGSNLNIKDGQKKVTIKIPCKNKVTKESIISMLIRIANCEGIDNEI